MVKRCAYGLMLSASFCIGLPQSTLAEQPRLIKEFRTEPAESLLSPGPLGKIDGYVYFRAVEPDYGAELWRSDGTSEGTTLFIDLWAGPASSNPQPIIQIGNVIFFSATDQAAGEELWRTDGTKEGTFRLGDLSPGRSLSLLDWAAAGSRLFFALRPGRYEKDELWITDGTREGTSRVRKMGVYDLTAVGDRVFFRADHTYDNQLWVSDGTEQGTVLVSPEPRVPLELFEWNGRLFFSAEDPDHGREAWLSDGTASGTRLLKDIRPGSADSNVSSCHPYGAKFKPVLLGERLFFSASDGEHGCELWVTDGTEQGTRLFLDAAPPFLSRSLGPSVAQEARFFFVSYSRLWVTDGTEQGTRRLAEDGDWESLSAVNTRSATPGGMYVNAIAPDGSGRRVFFQKVIYSGKWGTDAELWVTDGSSGGTFPLSPVGRFKWPWAELDGAYVFIGDPEGLGASPGLWRAGVAGGGGEQYYHVWPEGRPNLVFLGDLGDRVLFAAADGVHGKELWVTDGTSAGTSLLLDIHPGWWGQLEREIAAAGGLLFFRSGPDYDELTAQDRFGVELWRTDGTGAGTYRVGDLYPGPKSSDPSHLTAVGGSLFFYARDEDGRRLFITDGSRSGTRSIDGVPQRNLVGTKKYAFFRTGTRARCELWRTDGSESGTLMVSEHDDADRYDSTYRACKPNGLVNDLVFYQADHQLWRSDGSPEGTFALLRPLEEREIEHLATSGNRLYFTDRNTLWSTDGSVSGTQWLSRFLSYATRDSLTPSGSGDELFFLANDRVNGNSLWTTDGTRAGTRLVKDFRPAGDATYITEILGAAEGTVFFIVRMEPREDGGGRWLWKSDGTPAGTRLVAPLFAALVEEPVKAIDNVLYFVAKNEATGRELWRTDGTRKGTRLVADLNPGPASSAPKRLTLAGGNLFFYAKTEREGHAIWVLDTAHDPVARAPKLSSPTDLGESGPREVALLGSRLSLLDARTGAVVSSGPFAPSESWGAVDVEWMPDANGDGQADLAVLARWRSKARVFALDGLTGEVFSSKRLSGEGGPLDLEVLPDQATRDQTAFVLSRQSGAGVFGISSTAIGPEEKASPGVEIDLPKSVRAYDLEVIRAGGRDREEAGYELAVLAGSGSRQNPRVLTYDAGAGFVTGEWGLDDTLVPIDLEPLDSGPDAAKVAVLAERRSSTTATVLTLDSTTGEVSSGSLLKKKFSALDLETVPSPAGSRDQNVGVLWVSRRNEPRVGVTILDALTGEKRATVRLNGVRRPRDFAFARAGRRQAQLRIAVLGDAACGERKDRRKLAVTLWDVDTRQRIACHAVE